MYAFVLMLMNVAELVRFSGPGIGRGEVFLRVLVCPLDAVEDMPVFWVIAIHLRVLFS